MFSNYFCIMSGLQIVGFRYGTEISSIMVSKMGLLGKKKGSNSTLKNEVPKH